MAKPKDRAAAVARKLVRVRQGQGFAGGDFQWEIYIAGKYMRPTLFPNLDRKAITTAVTAALRKAGVR